MAEILRPTSYTFSGSGTNDNPSYVYDGDIATYNNLGVSNNNADPTIIYHTWQTGAAHSKRTLYISRSGVGNANDKWGIYYSTNGGSGWIPIETDLINPSKEEVGVEIATDVDLSNLQVKISTAKVAAPDNGYARIYEVYLYCDLAGSTETLRPNAAGDETSIASQYPASGSHWDKVDEAAADDGTTDVYTSSTTYQRDLYNLPASSGSGTINFVKVYFRIKTNVNGMAAYAKPSLKSNSTVTDGTEVTESAGTWTTYSQQWNTNPADSAAWEWADIDALQIGISLHKSSIALALCTQVYVEVDYTEAGGQDYPISCTANLTASATIDRDIDWDRNMSPALAVSAAVARALSYNRATISNLSTAVSIVKSWGRAIATISNLSISAAVSRAMAFNRAISSNLTAAISVVKSWGRTKATNTALVISATVSMSKGFVRSIIANMAASTTIGRALAYIRATTPGLTASATVDRTVAYARATNTALSVAISILKSLGRTITTNTGLTIAVSVIKSWGRKITTSTALSVAVTVAKTVAYNRVTQTALSVVSSITTTLGGITNYTINIITNLAVSVSMSRTVSYARSITANITLAISAVITAILEWIGLTLKSRKVSLTLQSRPLELTLQSRPLSLTLQSRPLSLTLQTRSFSLTLPGRT